MIGEIIGGPPGPEQRPDSRENKKQPHLSITPIRDIMLKRAQEDATAEESFPPNFRSLLGQLRRKNDGKN